MSIRKRGNPLSHPLDNLLTYAEKSYIRLEAEQLIADCLGQGDTLPFDQLIKELVLAGSASLIVLREILDAIRAKKTTLSQEGIGVRQDLMDAMAEFGVYLPELLSAEAPEAFRQICSQGLRQQVRELAIQLEVEDESLLEEICAEAGDRVSRVAKRMVLLMRLEASVLDWIKGLVYEAAHTVDLNDLPNLDRITH